MRNAIIGGFLTCLLPLLVGRTAAAELFEDGEAAFRRGEYQTAFRRYYKR